SLQRDCRKSLLLFSDPPAPHAWRVSPPRLASLAKAVQWAEREPHPANPERFTSTHSHDESMEGTYGRATTSIQPREPEGGCPAGGAGEVEKRTPTPIPLPGSSATM